MRRSNSKLVGFLWTVIGLLVVGAAVGAFILIHRANDLKATNDELTSDVTSLRRQLIDAQATPIPTPAPTPTPVPTPVPKATATPKPTTTPKIAPTVNPKQ